MNQKFFSLPAQKQQAILSAGYRVFSQNTYKNSPMSQIAAEAGISKSLLFHYFQNKKELYLFLWENCARITIEYLNRHDCYGRRDLFDSLMRGMQAKMEILRLYPDMGAFTVRAFYEKDPDITAYIQESISRHFDFKAGQTLLNLDPEQFIPGLDIEMMYKDMYWAAEGYLWEMMQRGEMDIPQMEQDFLRLIRFWEQIYLRKKED